MGTAEFMTALALAPEVARSVIAHLLDIYKGVFGTFLDAVGPYVRRSWAEWTNSNFHRPSSAVEGRNGCLSQSYHNGRGLTNRRLGALTTIHNYDTRRRDGSTPAERLYGQPFPDLFEWLIGQMGALPLPRKARQRVVHNPLAVNAVSA